MRTTISALLAALAIGICGCADAPRDLVAELGRRYRSAATYSDDGRVRITETRGGTTREFTLPFRVAFARPDRLRIEAYDVRVVADGTTFHAAVGSVPGQVLTEPVKSPLALEQIFADAEVRTMLAEGEAGCPTQLPLLLADDTIELILAEAQGEPRRVGTETIDGRPCTRIAITKPDGTLELWIDRETKLLRRMRIPTDAHAGLLSEQAGAPVGLEVEVDFTNASFDATIPAEAFAFAVPEGADRVARIEPLRPPRPVHPRIGTPADLPALITTDGLPVSRESLAGGPVVIEFFFEGCEPCTTTMPQVATGIARFAAAHAERHAGAAPRVRHLAVSADEKAVTDAALRRKLAEFGGVGELVRDPDVAAARTLGIESLPATVILTGDGTIADVLVGPHGPIADDVAATLTAVAGGTPTGPLVRERHERRLASYRRELDRASGAGAVEPLPEQVIVPRRQPTRFKLEETWRAERIGMPGNLVCIDAAQGAAEPRIVVLDGWRTVVELDATGREVERHELELPRDSGVGFLRTAVDGEGRRSWLAGARGGQHVFVFDAGWKKPVIYPEPGGATHEGISDAEMADLDGDGTPEIVVGYRGSVGVQAATLDGKRLWRDRSLGSVIDVALGPPPTAGVRRDVLCVTGSGRLARANPDADAPAGDTTADQPTLKGVHAGPVAPDAAWALVGIEGATVGEQTAVGLDPASLADTWRLPLAAGVHRAGPIDAVAWADLLGTPRRQWLIAAPDGSVTVAWADGRVVDRYCHGRPLVGLGGYRHEGRSYVVLATRECVEAFRIDDVALD
ncbi:MAG: DUF2092 domain-containing protein [Pirellulales bacterium]